MFRVFFFFFKTTTKIDFFFKTTFFGETDHLKLPSVAVVKNLNITLNTPRSYIPSIQ